MKALLRPLALPLAAAAIIGLVVLALSPSPDQGQTTRVLSAPELVLELVIDEPDMEPWGVAAGENGRILVTDRKRNDVLFFSASGTLLTSARRASSEKTSLFLEPTGVCWDKRSKRAFVADTGHSRIVALDGNGRFLFAFGTAGNAPGQFTRPVGVAVDDNGLLYVVQVDDARLQVFTGDGTLKTVRTASELGMTYLWDVACLPQGGVVLSSALGGLATYDTNLEAVAGLAERGIGRGCYLFTTGLAADERGRILACAKTQGKVLLLGPPTQQAPRGQLLAEIQSTDGPGYGALEAPMLASFGTVAANSTVRRHLRKTILYPMDAAFLPSDRLAIVERGNRRVLVFRERAKGRD